MRRRCVSWLQTLTLLGFPAVLGLTAGAGVASATTLIMPNRDALKGVNVVVWGNTTQANGTAFSLDCGDGGAPLAGSVADQSYITRTCKYAGAGVFAAKLTVGAESATAQVTVHDAAALSATDLRAVKINMAIEDGLRFLYFSQFDRAARFNTNMTSWRSALQGDNFTNSFSALAVLAIQNQGHPVNGPGTDIFQPVVQRGLNWLFDELVQRDMSPCAEPAGNPCIAVPAPVNIGLAAPLDGFDGYATQIFAAAIASATAAAPARTVGAGIGSGNGNFVVGKTYAEILQRIVNASAWGQTDGPVGGGWYYTLEPGLDTSDGTVLGWAMLGLIDATAAGAKLPTFVKPRVATVLTNQLNTNGTLDYQANGQPASTKSNPGKTGVGLQALAFTGVSRNDARVQAVLEYLAQNWDVQTTPTDFNCQDRSLPPLTPPLNKGCGDAMFNIFKGLRLYGVQDLGVIGDWYADYVDNLLANQHLPADPTRGEWSTDPPSMFWSCCEQDTTGITALAELILAPVAFVPPTSLVLEPPTATNSVGTPHTVIATATTAAGSPDPGVTVTFTVISGPNAGRLICKETGTNTNTTDDTGRAFCTYVDVGGAGTDTIQASVVLSTGTLTSNVVTKIWQAPQTIPTLSEWGQFAMGGVLLLGSLWALRRRKGYIG